MNISRNGAKALFCLVGLGGVASLIQNFEHAVGHANAADDTVVLDVDIGEDVIIFAVLRGHEGGSWRDRSANAADEHDVAGPVAVAQDDAPLWTSEREGPRFLSGAP